MTVSFDQISAQLASDPDEALSTIRGIVNDPTQWEALSEWAADGANCGKLLAELALSWEYNQDPELPGLADHLRIARMNHTAG